MNRSRNKSTEQVSHDTTRPDVEKNPHRDRTGRRKAKDASIERILPGSDEDNFVEDTQPDPRGPQRETTRNDDNREPDALGPMGNGSRDDSDVEGVHEHDDRRGVENV